VIKKGAKQKNADIGVIFNYHFFSYTVVGC
jgi:hypothetical protein